MPSFTDDDRERMRFAADCTRAESAFSRGRLTPEDRAWLEGQLEEAEADVERLAQELRDTRAWRRRVAARLRGARRSPRSSFSSSCEVLDEAVGVLGAGGSRRPSLRA